MKWQATGAIAPTELSVARLQVHYGALVLGSAAYSVLESLADDSQTNLGFEGGALRTHPLDSGGNVTLQLELSTFALVLRSGSEERARLALDGQTLAGAFAWAGRELAGLLGVEVSVVRREYPDFPDSPLSQGAVFERPSDAELAELAAWFANGVRLFEGLRGDAPALSPVRVWPHHFDLGALLPLDDGGERSIGMGLSPGDEHYDQPYFYCSPYPQPGADTALPPLPAGAWRTEGFVSAILTAEEVQACTVPADAAGDYLSAALAACRRLLA